MSAALRVRVEGVVASQGIVLARPLEVGELRMSPSASLGGRRVRGFDLPRKVLEDGSVDLSLFGFFLENPAEVAHFVVGDEVVYTES
jgi:hypothetical protein